ncbi:hypothetical protein GCM10011404_32950 [Sphingomonas prati]|nr:hypothetical protein GCM10011404_32950 [Sphingomonas prati]
MLDALIVRKLWRVTVSSLFPNDKRVECFYDGLYANEDAARDAALSKEAFDHGGATIATVISVERIR